MKGWINVIVSFTLVDIILCAVYIFWGTRWIFKSLRLGRFSVCNNWKIMALKLYILLLVPLSLFFYFYFAGNPNLRVLLGTLIIIFCGIGEYLLFKEMQSIIKNTLSENPKYEFNEEFSREKFKFQIHIAAMGMIAFMGLLTYFFAD